MNRSTPYWPASWHSTRLERRLPSLPDEEDVGPGSNVVFHADFAAEAVHALDPAAFDRRDQGRMRIERPVAADLSLQAERLAIGGQQQLDGGGIEADAVVERGDAVALVDAADHHHAHQHLQLVDVARIAREQRFDRERLDRPTTTKSTQEPGMSTRGSSSADLVDLGDDDAMAEGGGLDDRRRVLGVGAGIEIAWRIGLFGADQRDVGVRSTNMRA